MNRSEGRLVTLVAAGLVCAAAIYTSIVGLKSEHCVIPIGYNIKSVPAHLSEGSTQHVPEKIKSIIEEIEAEAGVKEERKDKPVTISGGLGTKILLNFDDNLEAYVQSGNETRRINLEQTETGFFYRDGETQWKFELPFLGIKVNKARLVTIDDALNVFVDIRVNAYNQEINLGLLYDSKGNKKIEVQGQQDSYFDIITLGGQLTLIEASSITRPVFGYDHSKPSLQNVESGMFVQDPTIMLRAILNRGGNTFLQDLAEVSYNANQDGSVLLDNQGFATEGSLSSLQILSYGDFLEIVTDWIKTPLTFNFADNSRIERHDLKTVGSKTFQLQRSGQSYQNIGSW